MKKKSYITVTDQFCGAGGSSSGVRKYSINKGGGIEIKLALNHWKLAIDTHNTNFPDTDHECTDISACDPRRYPSTDVLITSPECTNHSLAKGKVRRDQNQLKLFGKTKVDPGDERSRATMWDVPRFAEVHNYNIVITENVVDARSWIMWDAWILAMHKLGYNHKCCYFNSMHFHPTPQSRDRMYVVFWKKGNKTPKLDHKPEAFCTRCEKNVLSVQRFKNPLKKYGKYKVQYGFVCENCGTAVEPYYYSAFNCIDWNIPGRRIGDRKKELSPNTVRRIEFGINKYWSSPQIISTRYTTGVGYRVKNALTDSLPTQPGDISQAILNPLVTISSYVPLISSKEYDLKNQRIKDAINEIGFTQTTHANIGVVMPFIIEMNRTGKARAATEALSTILAGGNHHGLLTPLIVECKGESTARNITDRMPCITTKPSNALLVPEIFQSFLAQYNSSGNNVSHVTESLRTVMTCDRSMLITPGKKPELMDCYYRMLLPHEVKSGMAFDSDYVILGNSKEKVKQCGNAVTPPTMEWIFGQCIESLN